MTYLKGPRRYGRNGQTKAKKRLLTSLGWEVVNVPWFVYEREIKKDGGKEAFWGKVITRENGVVKKVEGGILEGV